MAARTIYTGKQSHLAVDWRQLGWVKWLAHFRPSHGWSAGVDSGEAGKENKTPKPEDIGFGSVP